MILEDLYSSKKGKGTRSKYECLCAVLAAGSMALAGLPLPAIHLPLSVVFPH